MRTPISRVCVVAVASTAYSFLTSGGVFSESTVGAMAAAYGPPYFAMLWVVEDARSSGYWPAYHYGLFVCLLWFIAIPHYCLRTRGRRGVLPALGWLVLLSMPLLAAFVGALLYYELPDLRA